MYVPSRTYKKRAVISKNNEKRRRCLFLAPYSSYKNLLIVTSLHLGSYDAMILFLENIKCFISLFFRISVFCHAFRLNSKFVLLQFIFTRLLIRGQQQRVVSKVLTLNNIIFILYVFYTFMHQEKNSNGLAKVHYKSYISAIYKAKEVGKNRWLNSLQGTKYVYLTLQTIFLRRSTAYAQDTKMEIQMREKPTWIKQKHLWICYLGANRSVRCLDYKIDIKNDGEKITGYLSI